MDRTINIPRRRFLGEASCAGIGSASVLSSALNLRLMGQVAAADMPSSGSDYRAVVCLFLTGGNDSYSMLTPVDTAGYDEYSQVRQNIAHAQSEFTVLSNSDSNGRQLGLHNSMPNLRGLYEAGNAAFVANVGSLVRPTSREDVFAGRFLPEGLFSHSDQMQHWQSGLPQDRSATTGWGGRMADLLEDTAVTGDVSMSLSIAGINLFQTGASTSPFVLSPSGAKQLTLWDAAHTTRLRTAVSGLLEAEYDDAFQRSFAESKLNAINLTGDYLSAIGSVPPLTTVFPPSNELAQQFKQVAQTMAARETLGASRQTFFVELQGFDTHAVQSSAAEGLLGVIDEAIGSFWAALCEMGLSENVVLYTGSDFGRTLTSNGKGSDHAWGGNHFVIGGAINGGRIFGTYPELAEGSSSDLGRGRLLPSLSVDEYMADLATWMGVSANGLEEVLPNLSEFHPTSSTDPCLGLFSPSSGS